MSKSRPVYAPFALDYSGAFHLIVTDLPRTPEDIDTALSNIEIFTAATHPGVALFDALSVYFSASHMGLRLYAIGGEAFLWDVHAIAVAAGMGEGEIYLTRAGALSRRVYCTHCRAMMEAVAENITPCAGCGAALFVRDHYSRRLRAFMGVKVDAEVPGEVPPAEVFVS